MRITSGPGVAQMALQANAQAPVNGSAQEQMQIHQRDLAAEAGPLIDSAWAARDQWQLIDHVDDLGLGGAVNATRRRTLAESGDVQALSQSVQAPSPDRERYRIDLARVVSRYIGETEKHLDAVFGRAERYDPVLLFDEADALFERRADVRESHDRFVHPQIGELQIPPR